jgi:hypothetical protein
MANLRHRHSEGDHCSDGSAKGTPYVRTYQPYFVLIHRDYMSGKSNSAQIMFFVLLVSLFSSVNFSADSFVMEISENLDSLNDSSIVKSNQNDSSVSDQWSFETGGAVEPVAISDDGRYIVGGSDDFGVYLFESASSQKMWEYSARGQFLFLQMANISWQGE